MKKVLLEVDARKIAKESAELLKKEYKVAKVYLIGSLLDDRFSNHSDIDLVVESLPSHLYFKALALLMRRYFSSVKIDIIPFEDCSSDFQDKIIEHGEILIGG